MAGEFMTRLVSSVQNSTGGDAKMRALIARSIVDTLAVAAAGFGEPVTRHSLAAYAGGTAATWSGETCEGPEAAVFINAVAAHALDFDDVMLDSTAHTSVSILPAILGNGPVDPDELIAAFGAGLIAARAIGRRVGAGHYYKGWHATGTFGAFAAAAALARLRRLPAEHVRAAMGLAAVQSGGLKINFGTMAKPAHAGFAAAAGFRAVRLAMAGVEAASDVFADPIGYAALYGTGDGDSNPDDSAFEVRPDRVSVKLYPCCYAAHRLIGLGLDARREVGPDFLARGGRAVLTVPKGSIDLIRYDTPTTALQAKFSAKYAFVEALETGQAGLAAFTDEAVRRPELAENLDRLELVEDATQTNGSDIESGEVNVELWDAAGQKAGRAARRTIPGSPDAPPQPAEIAAKAEDCLKVFRAQFRGDFQPLAALVRHPEFRVWMGASDKDERSAA